jgi:hypothetical protein
MCLVSVKYRNFTTKTPCDRDRHRTTRGTLEIDLANHLRSITTTTHHGNSAYHFPCWYRGRVRHPALGDFVHGCGCGRIGQEQGQGDDG